MNKRKFIKSIGLTGALMPFFGWEHRKINSYNLELLKPKSISKGDKVGLISPSAAMAEGMQIRFAIETLEALEFKVVTGKYVAQRHGHLAGTDEERASDMNDMFSDPEIKMIICIRGGSGAARILPLINYDNIKENPKPFLGYSDITALHMAIHAQTGLITFHGPNGSGSWNGFNVSQFEKLFFEREKIRYQNEEVKSDDLVAKQNRIQTIRSGIVEGKIIGGNLTVLTALAGSPYLPDFKDKILFLEDIQEQPYKIDRMFSTLKLMGALDKISGFIFGQCTQCQPSDGYGSLTIEQILDDYILPLNIPAYYGAMIGHIPKQFIIPIGARVAMDADYGIIELKEEVFS